MYPNLRFWVHVYIFAAPIKIINIMTAVLIIVAIAIIAGIAISSANKKAHEEGQRKAAEQPKTETNEAKEETDDEYAGLSYEEKIEKIEKDLEKILFETISSFEMTRGEKVSLVTDFLSSLDENPQLDETKILKAVVRKIFKTLIDKTPDPLKRADYEERFEEEKEEMRSRDYVVIDSQWNQFLDDFDDLKADLEALQEKPQPKPQRSFGISTMETRTDEVDGQPCQVANFAVKGLFFRSPEDQDAARTLKVGDPLHMEHEEGNEKDPNAMKVTMADGHHIGYVDSKCSGYVRENQPRLLKFVVSKVDDYADPPYIYAEAFFKNE